MLGVSLGSAHPRKWRAGTIGQPCRVKFGGRPHAICNRGQRHTGECGRHGLPTRWQNVPEQRQSWQCWLQHDGDHMAALHTWKLCWVAHCPQYHLELAETRTQTLEAHYSRSRLLVDNWISAAAAQQQRALCFREGATGTWLIVRHGSGGSIQTSTHEWLTSHSNSRC